MKSFPQFPKGVCDPERLKSSRQSQSGQLQSRPGREGSRRAPSRLSRSHGALGEPWVKRLKGDGDDQGQIRAGAVEKKRGSRISNLGQEFLKAKYLGL